MQFVLNFNLTLKFAAPVSGESGVPENSATFFQTSHMSVDKTTVNSVEMLFLSTLHSPEKLLSRAIDLVMLQMANEIFVVRKL